MFLIDGVTLVTFEDAIKLKLKKEIWKKFLFEKILNDENKEIGDQR